MPQWYDRGSGRWNGPTLVPVDFVALITGESRERVLEMVEEGSFPWAFEFAREGAHRRTIRIWAQGIPQLSEASPKATDIGPELVLQAVIGPTPAMVRSAILCQRWALSRQWFLESVQTGVLRGAVVDHSLRIERASLLEFLRAAQVGGRLAVGAKQGKD